MRVKNLDFSHYPTFPNNLHKLFHNVLYIHIDRLLFILSLYIIIPYKVFINEYIIHQNKRKGSVILKSEMNGTSLINLSNIKKSFITAAGNFDALKGINLEVKQGELIAVVGKSGSGKSTLMNMIAGIDKPSSGEIMIGDKKVHTMSENQISKWRGITVGVVFQFFQLLPTLTVIENVMLPMDFCKTYPLSKRKDRALDLLRQVGIEDQAYKFPTALSGGQQQRTAIARALANNPSIILADEPTGNLDTATANDVFDIFNILVSNSKTVIIVTHDQDIANRCSRTIKLTDGLIA